MTYQDYCRKVCEGCGKGLRKGEGLNNRFHFDMQPATSAIPCTAPTESALIEHLAAEIAFVTKERDEANSLGASLGILADKRKSELAALKQERDKRQRCVAEWCAAAFGAGHAASLPQRGIRLAEEAIEAAQAAGCESAMLHSLVDHVYARPPGTLSQELGGIGVTLLALAQAADLSAEAEEIREIERVLSKPLAHFAARNKAKNDAGFNVADSARTQEESNA